MLSVQIKTAVWTDCIVCVQIKTAVWSDVVVACAQINAAVWSDVAVACAQIKNASVRSDVGSLCIDTNPNITVAAAEDIPLCVSHKGIE